MFDPTTVRQVTTATEAMHAAQRAAERADRELQLAKRVAALSKWDVVATPVIVGTVAGGVLLGAAFVILKLPEGVVGTGVLFLVFASLAGFSLAVVSVFDNLRRHKSAPDNVQFMEQRLAERVADFKDATGRHELSVIAAERRAEAPLASDILQRLADAALPEEQDEITEAFELLRNMERRLR